MYYKIVCLFFNGKNFLCVRISVSYLKYVVNISVVSNGRYILCQWNKCVPFVITSKT